MGEPLFNSSKVYLMNRNQALQIVAHVVEKDDYEKANKMLSIIDRSIKEDKNNKIVTNLVRFINDEEYALFNHELE